MNGPVTFTVLPGAGPDQELLLSCDMCAGIVPSKENVYTESELGAHARTHGLSFYKVNYAIQLQSRNPLLEVTWRPCFNMNTTEEGSALELTSETLAIFGQVIILTNAEPGDYLVALAGGVFRLIKKQDFTRYYYVMSGLHGSNYQFRPGHSQLPADPGLPAGTDPGDLQPGN